jgi:uncharacterized protein YjaZ
MMILDKKTTNLMQDTEYAIEMYEAYEKLSKQKAFNKLINEGFIKEFALNNVSLLNCSNEQGQKLIQDTLMGISVFENFLISVQRFGESAKKSKEEGVNAEFTGEDVTSLEEEAGVI